MFFMPIFHTSLESAQTFKASIIRRLVLIDQPDVDHEKQFSMALPI